MVTSRPKHIVCILGMHRSGTSCLTGTLQELGLNLGKHHTWNPYNLKGNRENQDIVDFHDQLLADNGGSWCSPPRKVVWTEKHYQQARQILGTHANEEYWGFKDPRSLLTYDGWLRLCPDLILIGIFRHPTSVANSLAGRGGHSRKESYRLWKIYNQRLLRLHKPHTFPVLNFDWDPKAFNKQSLQVAQEIGLTPQNTGTAFYSEELRSHDQRQEHLPWGVKYTYKSLLRISKL
ncbi:sulfotransferase family protein [Ketobacter sp.]